MAAQNWILLQGLCRESRHWGNFPKSLQNHLADSAVRCIDLPGNGPLNTQQCPTTICQMIDLLHRQHRPEQPVYLLGMSLGGMLAYHWMQRYPDDLLGVVLINSSLGHINRWYHRLRPSALPMLINALRKSGYQRERAIFELTCNSQKNREETLSFWQLYQLERPVSYQTFRYQLQLAGSCEAEPYPPKKPVLILSSARDQLVDPNCSEQMARAWQMPHQQHPDAGHDLPHDDPDWVIRQLTSWLKD